MAAEKKRVRCVVGCRDTNGVPALVGVIVDCTVTKYENGDHYAMAAKMVEADGYEDAAWIADEVDGPTWLFSGIFDHDKELRSLKRKIGALAGCADLTDPPLSSVAKSLLHKIRRDIDRLIAEHYCCGLFTALLQLLYGADWPRQG